MMEWTTVTVIIALVGLGAAVIKPIVSLTQTITKLTDVVDWLRRDMEGQKQRIHESFSKVWAHNEEQDDQLSDHENRITLLERKD